MPDRGTEHLIDDEGRIYRPSLGREKWQRTDEIDWGLRSLLRITMEEAAKASLLVRPAATDVTGRALYYDPRHDPRSDKERWLPILSHSSQQQRAGLGAMGVLGIIGVLAVVGVVIWVIVAHLQSGYAPSRALHDPSSCCFQSSVNAIAYSSNGKELIAADRASGPNLWDAGSGKLVNTFSNNSTDFYATRAAFSPSGKLLAVGDYDGTVYLWNIVSGHQLFKFTDYMANGFNSPYSGGVYGLSFSPDGKILAAAEFDGKVYLWRVRGRKRIAVLHVSHNGDGVSGYMAFSPSGKILAVGDENGKTYIWNVAKKRQVAVLNYSQSAAGVTGLAFSSNGRTLATLETDGTAVLWNTSTWNEAGSLSAGNSDSTDNCSIAFSPSGKTLAAGCNRANTYLWDVASQRKIATLTASSGDITGVAFSPDGSTLAAGTDSGYIYLWSVKKLISNG